MNYEYNTNPKLIIEEYLVVYVMSIFQSKSNVSGTLKQLNLLSSSMEDKELKITSYMIVHLIGYFLEEMSTLMKTIYLKF